MNFFRRKILRSATIKVEENEPLQPQNTEGNEPYPGIIGYSSGGYLGAGGFVSPPGPPSSTGGAQGGATGFTPNASDAKAAEAAGLQTGYVDPNNPQMAYLPQV